MVRWVTWAPSAGGSTCAGEGDESPDQGGIADLEKGDLHGDILEAKSAELASNGMWQFKEKKNSEE